ncbi:phosphonopyruvate decarboxylase [Clostridium algidicarnis]|uniref:phosphonopyruvate decarboxylase n=1 Tax=Clostridium algidicarnis TaxID=37659 RepID=UPI001C0D5D17|nr:phosphonopyruvate decarboxylase [Clostridium algidicarnis]MBU3195902.1 phosphonopyruvate decarboxylase [Clostridium algidicarnis]MBU3208928.1 phosphonopyruvate decarboxylase [Clostridium algidicarnis]MBU3226559.1 phosphonopyruvate decarboxylase [Clostridium algidicarnis]MBU3250530.1 phosphonopyruvate decarboxylase [Clostridium algidicarnis]
MINTEEFYKELKSSKIDFFVGVPDSLLKDFCAYIKENVDSKHNIVAANEGNALAVASGYYLATGNPALVYMQNSGQGNIINPLASLNDPLVYSIPALLVIGWRGEPNKKDEPQHKKQGLVTLKLLEALDIEYSILTEKDDVGIWKKKISEAVEYMKKEKKPYALVVTKGTFSTYKLKEQSKVNFEMSREDAIKEIVNALGDEDTIVSTTGMASRELFEEREARNMGHEKDFLTVGSMGHASQIALGIALSKPKKNVYCLDGDGALLMHLGGLAIIGTQKVENFKHIVINNGAHDSVGGQSTVGFDIDIPSIAKSCGYKKTFTVSTFEDLKAYLKILVEAKGPVLLEVKVRKGARKDLGRPTTSPIENKDMFMKFLAK